MVRDLNEGRLETTGAPFDLAINGKGYFVVQTAARRPLHAQRPSHAQRRRPARHRQRRPDHGRRRRDHGHADDGDVHIAADGTVSGKQGQIGKLRRGGFCQRSRAEEGRRQPLFDRSDPIPAADKSKIVQGMLEASNVEPVIEISHMIDVMRAYQATATLAQSRKI